VHNESVKLMLEIKLERAKDYLLSEGYTENHAKGAIEESLKEPDTIKKFEDEHPKWKLVLGYQ
jgi:hypothetical protein